MTQNDQQMLPHPLNKKWDLSWRYLMYVIGDTFGYIGDLFVAENSLVNCGLNRNKGDLNKKWWFNMAAVVV